MFNIDKETERIVLLKQAKIYGLPKQHKPQRLLKYADNTLAEQIEIDAEREAIAIAGGFKNTSKDFGLRLRKARGEAHH